MIHSIKILLISGLCASLLYGAEEKGSSSAMNIDMPSNFVTIKLEDGITSLSQKEWERLVEYSETLKDMLSMVQINSSLPLPGVKKKTFEMLLKILKQSDAIEAINKLRFEQQLDLWGCANFLEISLLLSSLDTIIAQGLIENKDHLLTQFMENPSSTIKLLTSYGIDMASHDIGYAMIKSHLKTLWIPESPTIIKAQTSIKSVSWSPDGTMIVFCAGNGIYIWDFNKKQQHQLITANVMGTVNSVAWSPNGKMIASASDHGIHILNVQDGKILNEITNPTNCMAWSPDSTRIVFSLKEDKSVCIWNIETKEVYKVSDCLNTFRVLSVAWSPDGKMIAFTENNKVHIWDINQQKIVSSLNGEGITFSVAWSPDSEKIVSGAMQYGQMKGAMRIWSTHGLLIHSSDNPVFSVAWSPNGKMIVSGSNKTVYIWDAQDGILCELIGHENIVDCVAWNPDNKMVASSSKDQVRIWNIQPLIFAQHITLLDGLIMIATIKNPAWLNSATAQTLIASQPWYKPYGKTKEDIITITEIFNLVVQDEIEKNKKYKNKIEDVSQEPSPSSQ